MSSSKDLSGPIPVRNPNTDPPTVPPFGLTEWTELGAELAALGPRRLTIAAHALGLQHPVVPIWLSTGATLAVKVWPAALC